MTMVGVAGNTLDAFGKNRKFQAGKTGKRAAETLAAVKERDLTDEAKAEAAQTQVVLEEYRALRGPSLMDLHHSDKKHKGGVESAAGDTSSHRRQFDRERVRRTVAVLVSCRHCLIRVFA
jgi:hypothetical protein